MTIKPASGELGIGTELVPGHHALLHRDPIDVLGNDVIGDGTDETSVIVGLLNEAGPNACVYFPKPPVRYGISDAITMPHDGMCIHMDRATVIQQATWGKPAFDLTYVSDCLVQGGKLINVAPRANLTSSFRGAGLSTYTAGVWCSGDRNLVKDVYVEGFVVGVIMTNFNGTDHTTYRYDNAVENLLVKDVDWAVLAAGQVGMQLDGIRGTYLQSSLGNPSHLIYLSSLSSGLRNIDTRITDCYAHDSLDGHAYQFFACDGLQAHNLKAKGCAGLFSISDVVDSEFTGFSSRATAAQAGLGAIYLQSGGEHRNLFADGIVDMAASERAIRAAGDDNIWDNVRVRTNRPADTDDFDIYVPDGNRTTLRGVQIDAAGAGGGVGIYLGGGTDHRIIDPRVRGANGSIENAPGATGLIVDYDPNLLSAKAGHTKVYLADRTGAVVNRRNAIAPVTGVSSYTIDPTATTHLVITQVTNTNLTLNALAAQTCVKGMELVVDVVNATGGAYSSTLAWPAGFLLAGAFTYPANGKRRTIRFYFDGTNWVELARAAADI